MNEELSRERRRFFRLPYPEGPVRPTLLTLNGSFAVSEISEKGLRFICRRVATFKMNQHINGVVRFQNGQTCPIQGVVMRLTAMRDSLPLQRYPTQSHR